MINLKFTTGLIAAVMLILCCCTIRHKPKASLVEYRLIPNFSVKGPIEVISGQKRSQQTLEIVPHDVIVDYQQVGELAKQMLESELEKNQSARSDQGSKILKIGITDIRISPKFQCIIYFSVDGGNGYKKGHQAKGQSWNYNKAIDRAIADIAVKILNDESILNYLES